MTVVVVVQGYSGIFCCRLLVGMLIKALATLYVLDGTVARQS